LEVAGSKFGGVTCASVGHVFARRGLAIGAENNMAVVEMKWRLVSILSPDPGRSLMPKKSRQVTTLT
jgi:hypothetical protein